MSWLWLSALGLALLARIVNHVWYLDPVRALAGFWLFLMVQPLGVSECTSLILLSLVLVSALFSGRTFSHSVRGTVCLVTGASSGIGLALATECAKRGAAAVVLVARSLATLQEAKQTVEQAAGACKIVTVVCDVTDPVQCDKLRETVLRECRRAPDIIFNNAGSGQWRHMEEETYDTGASTIASPYLGAFNVTRAFIDDFVARRSGHFVITTSAAAFIPFRGAVGYRTARVAMKGFSESLRADLRELGIGVTLLSPTETDGTQYFVKAGEASHNRIPYLFSKSSPMGSLLKVETADVARAAVSGVLKGKQEIHCPSLVLSLVPLIHWFPELLEDSTRLGRNGLRSSDRENRKKK